jgi:hypothetical protein
MQKQDRVTHVAREQGQLLPQVFAFAEPSPRKMPSDASISSGKNDAKKAGSKSVAIKLYGKRIRQVLEGKKLPELFWKPSINFGQLQ